MIQVKENLLKGYGGTYKVEAKNTGGNADSYNYQLVTVPISLEENQQYTICFKFKQYNGSGNFTVGLFNKSNTTPAVRTTYEVSDKQFFSFTYEKGVTDNILIYTDVAGQTRGVGAEIKDIILFDGYYEDIGEEIVYLPHKENVEIDSQAIFPIEGRYHEVLPI